MRPHALLLTVLAVLIAPPASAALALLPCRLEAPGTPIRLDAECGELAVPLDRAAPDGANLSLFVARLPAAARKPRPDPIFFLAGGPGQAATEAYPQIAGALSRLNETRDVILVDQRGTGRSNPLDCPFDALTEMASAAASELAFRDCLAGIDADPRQFTTVAAVADLDAVREALGVELINLIGVSYGTRVAQTYAAMFPQHLRTMVLDSVLPQEHALGSTIATDAQRALDLLTERCAHTAACAAAFPAVASELSELLAALDGPARPLSFDHPTSGAPVSVEVDRDVVAGIVRLLLYSPETASLLPLLIHHAQQGKDPQRLVAQALIGGEAIARTMSQGLLVSVVCAEDAPFLDFERARRDAAATVFGGAFLDFLQSVCSAWPHAEVPAAFKERLTSSVPTLLLSGEADPVTPPERAEQMRQGLTSSIHLVAPGMGHNLLFRGCVPRLIEELVESGSIDGIDGRCVSALRPPPFFLSFAGPLASPAGNRR